MKEKYINHCKSRLFKKNIFPANVGHLSIQIKIRVKKCHFCWRYLRLAIESREKPGNDGKKGVIFIYIKN